jgi:hypothetical protein
MKSFFAPLTLLLKAIGTSIAAGANLSLSYFIFAQGTHNTSYEISLLFLCLVLFSNLSAKSALAFLEFYDH